MTPTLDTLVSCILPSSSFSVSQRPEQSLTCGHLSGGTSASCCVLWQEYLGKWVFFFNGGRWSLPPTKTLSVWNSPNLEMLLVKGREGWTRMSNFNC